MSESKSPARKTKKRIARIMRVCRQKKTYDTLDDVSAAIDFYGFHNGFELGYYDCPNCNKFHLTSRAT